MEKQMKGKLGNRELATLILILVGSKLSDMTPSMLAQDAKNAFWMVPILSFIVFLPSLLILLYLLKKFKDMDLFELINKIFGKYIGFCIMLVFFLVSILATAFDTRSYVDAMDTMYFPKSPLIVTFAIFIVTAYFIAKRGFEAFSSTTYLVTPYIKVSLLVLLYLISKDIVWQRIFPIFGGGFDIILLDSVTKSSIYGDIMVLTLAYTYFKKGTKFGTTTLITSGVVAIELLAFFLAYALLFDYKTIDNVAYPFHEATKYVSIGTFFTNIETFYLSFWLVASLLRFGIYVYFATWIFGTIFKIKEFEPLLLPFCFLILTIGLIPDNPQENVMLLRRMLLNYSSFFFIGLPYLLWIVAKFRGELKKR